MVVVVVVCVVNVVVVVVVVVVFVIVVVFDFGEITPLKKMRLKKKKKGGKYDLQHIQTYVSMLKSS